MKKTLIIGASTDPNRYSFKAAHMLTRFGHPIINVGIKRGEVAGVIIEKPEKIHADIDTITLYIGPALQDSYKDYILSTHPKRVIFNPGTENPDLQNFLTQNQIAFEEACTLVLLSTGQY